MKVQYNGGTESYTSVSGDPTSLVKGKWYEVTSFNQGNWQTTFCLEGHEGDFNSVWFNQKSVFLVETENRWYPQEGGKLCNFHCYKLAYFGLESGDEYVLESDEIEKVTMLTKDMFVVETTTRIYLWHILGY